MGWRDLIQDSSEIGKMKRNELSKIVSNLSAVANKRLKRMQSKGILYSTQLYGEGDYISGVKKFGAKDKTLGQLRSEYKRLKGFLESKVSTLTGRKEQYYDFVNEIAKHTKTKPISRKEAYREYEQANYSNTNIYEEAFNEISSFWKIMREESWLAKYPKLANYSSTQLRDLYAVNYMETGSFSDAIKRMRSVLDEDTNEFGPEDNGTSQFI